MKHKKGFLPDWRIDQVRKISLRVAEQNFAQMIRGEMQQRGWKYDPGNNDFIKSGVQLYFSEGYGIFNRTGSDGKLSKIFHRFNILPDTLQVIELKDKLSKLQENYNQDIKGLEECLNNYGQSY